MDTSADQNRLNSTTRARGEPDAWEHARPVRRCGPGNQNIGNGVTAPRPDPYVRHEAPSTRWGEGPTLELSQQLVEAESSLIRGGTWVGREAALTKPGRSGTARRVGSGKQDGKVYECRNQWWNPLKSVTGSNLVDQGRAAAHTHR